MKRFIAMFLSAVILIMLMGYTEKKMSPNYGYPDGTPGQNDVQEIVIHHWGSDEATFAGSEGWLCNPASQVSAHYVVSGDQAHCILDPKNAGWHCGNKWHNMHSIGIECNPRCSNEDMETVAHLIADIWRSQGKKIKVIGHKDIVPTDCPGRWYEKLDVLYDMAEEIYENENKS